MLIVHLEGTVGIYSGGDYRALFFDGRDRVACCDNGGLLSFVLHPQFEQNGFVFAQYVEASGDTVVSRFTRAASPATAVIDAATERILMVVDQPPTTPNHHGGELVFGPDGYLYISIGEGGSYRNVTNAAQELDHFLGKLLRIDVDRGEPYSIPSDNPFVGVSGARPEIWAYGLRNPWRYSFEPASGLLLLPDIGHDLWEEVNILPNALARGANFRWPHMEGSHCFLPSSSCLREGLIMPVLEYTRDDGCSITGGHIYRGVRASRLRGSYIYGDWCSGKIGSASRDASGEWQSTLLAQTNLSVVGFGEDARGELYVVDFNGSVARFDAPARRTRPVRR